jgi:hypothetical protein
VFRSIRREESDSLCDIFGLADDAKATGETSPDTGEDLQSLVLSAADVAAVHWLR